MVDVVGAGKFLREQTERVLPKIYETIYPRTWGYEGMHHTSRPGGISIATDKIHTLRLDHVGVATDYGGTATDIPLANFGIETDSYNVAVAAIAAEWTSLELLKQREAQSSQTLYSAPVVDIVANYQAAMEKALREWVHLKTVFGNFNPNDPTEFDGLLTGSEVNVVTEATDLYSLTPVQLYDFFLDVINEKKKETELTSADMELLVPSDLLNQLLKVNTAGIDLNETPYNLLIDPLRGNRLARISELNELSASKLEQYGVLPEGTNRDMFCLFNVPQEGEPENRLKLMSDTFRTPPRVKDDGITWRTVGFIGVSEMIFNQPIMNSYYTFAQKS
jgi:hypothetical protein